MKKIAITLLILFAIQAELSEEACVQYKCNNDNDTCWIGNENITYVKKCKTEGTECVVTDNKGECKPKKAKTDLYPGFPCTKNEECLSGTCNKVCVGKKVEEACNSTSECDPNLYCSNGKCTKVLEKDSACQKDYECSADSGCLDNKCTPFLSKKVGEEIISKKNVLFCETFFAYQADDGKVYCATAEYVGDSYECADEQTTCKYTVNYGKDKIGNVTDRCDCNAEKPGLFCSFGQSHKEYKKAVESISNYYKKEAHKYSSLEKFATHNYEFRKALYKIDRAPMFDGVSDCVIDGILSMSYIKISIFGLAIFALLF